MVADSRTIRRKGYSGASTPSSSTTQDRFVLDERSSMSLPSTVYTSTHPHSSSPTPVPLSKTHTSPSSPGFSTPPLFLLHATVSNRLQRQANGKPLCSPRHSDEHGSHHLSLKAMSPRGQPHHAPETSACSCLRRHLLHCRGCPFPALQACRPLPSPTRARFGPIVSFLSFSSPTNAGKC